MPKSAADLSPALATIRAKSGRKARFVEEYVRLGAGDGAGKEAAIAAGYSAKRAAVTASEFLAEDLVKQAVQELLKPVVESLGVDAARVLDIQAAIAAFEITDIAEVKKGKVSIKDTALWPPRARLAVAEVSETTTGVKVKLHDRAPALTFLARHLDMAAAVERWEVSGKNGGPIKVADATDEQLDARLAELLGKAGAGPAS